MLLHKLCTPQHRRILPLSFILTLSFQTSASPAYAVTHQQDRYKRGRGVKGRLPITWERVSEQNSWKIFGSPLSLSVTFGIMCISSPKETLHVVDLVSKDLRLSSEMSLVFLKCISNSLVLMYTLLFCPENEDTWVFQNGGQPLSASVASRLQKKKIV